jgi:hypothetical protein
MTFGIMILMAILSAYTLLGNVLTTEIAFTSLGIVFFTPSVALLLAQFLFIYLLIIIFIL